MKITICIATCKRVNYLTNLLEKINELKIHKEVTVTVAVVDNDSNRTAYVILKEIEKKVKYTLIYDFESKQGIPFTRNKCISLVPGDTDFVLFIDDDEYPSVDWLWELVELQKNTNADLIQGQVKPHYLITPKKWILEGNFMDYPSLENGEIYPYDQVATNNLLVRYSLIKQLKGPFNEELGLTGSDDNQLGRDLHEIGCNMLFSSKAIVYEYLPTERLNFRWIMQRSYRTANTYWPICKNKSIFTFMYFFFTACIRILVGLSMFVPAGLLGLIFGYHYFFKAIRIVIRGIAIIAGLFGFYYEEYKYNYTSEKVSQ